MRGQLHLGDVLHPRADRRADLPAAVDGGVDDDAARKGLVAVQRGLPAAPQADEDLVVVLLVGAHAGKAARRLDGPLGGIEAGLGEEGGQGAVLSRAAGMELLRSEEHTSELQSLMRTSYAVFCLKKKKRRA